MGQEIRRARKSEVRPVLDEIKGLFLNLRYIVFVDAYRDGNVI